MNRLESESYVTVQNHPRLGASLLEPFFFLREASVLIAHHHERWDGSGYPYGIRAPSSLLAPESWPLPMRTMRSEYPKSHRVVRNHVALRIILVAAGTQFDPELVDALWLFQESIPGSDLIEPTMRNCFDSL